MTKPIMEEALEEVRRSGRLNIQERVFAKMKPHDPLADLIAGFSSALLEKLRAAETKYGYKNDWLRSDWEAECQKHLAEHLAKGDPRDVAAYAAFCWHHGWPTVSPQDQQAGEALTGAALSRWCYENPNLAARTIEGLRA